MLGSKPIAIGCRICAKCCASWRYMKFDLQIQQSSKSMIKTRLANKINKFINFLKDQDLKKN